MFIKSALKFLLYTYCLFSLSEVVAQSSANYNFATSANASLSSDKNGNLINFSAEPNLIPNNITERKSAVVDMGIGFVFMGRYYTHIVAGDDGQLALGLASSTPDILFTGGINALRRGTSYPPGFYGAPNLTAFWDDLRTSTTGSTVRTKLVGVAPRRCFVIQWNVAINASSTTATDPSDGVYQIRLYEGTGEIEYVYGKMQIGAGSTTVTASIGFTNGINDNDFIALKDLSSFNITRVAGEEFATRSLINNMIPGPIAGLHSTADGSRRRFSFVPVVANGNFLSSGISRLYARSMQLNWSDNISNKLGYLLYRSIGDSNHYQLVTSLPATAAAYNASNLNTNTRYYWKVVSVTEGNTVTAAVLTDSTRCTMKGTYTIGTGGSFSTIGAAADSLALWGIAGPITLELLSSFNLSTEALPITFKSAAPCQETNYTLTIRPTAGATFNFLNNGSAPIFLIDSFSNVIIDGRAGGVGATALTLEGPGELVKIRNGWRNTIRYVDFKSNTSTATVSPVIMEGTIGGGSYLNTIANCSFHDRGASFTLPMQFIKSTAEDEVTNRDNNITDCQFYNFRRYALDLNGGWGISNNSFYATVPVTGTDTSGFITVVTSDDSSTNQITSNYFGGTGPNCTGNALIWNATIFFSGINLSGNSNVENNHFKRLQVRATSTSLYLHPYLNLLRLGSTYKYRTRHYSVKRNRFGDVSPGDSITFIGKAASRVTAVIITELEGGKSTIDSNSMVHIRTSTEGPSTDLGLILISTHGYSASVTNNTLGTANHAYRIAHSGSGAMNGILTTDMAEIQGNLITNIVAKNQIAGIICSNNKGEVSSNVISYLTSREGTESSQYYSVAGIVMFGSQSEVTRNKILFLQDSSINDRFTGPSAIFSHSSYNKFTRNLIDGLLQHPQSIESKSSTGFDINDSDYSSITNNMLRLGLDSAGKPVTGSFHGFVGSLSGNDVTHNTFYITGHDPDPLTSFSYCVFYLGRSNFVNNIFVNNRTTASGSPSSIFLTSTDAHDSFIDYNLYYLDSARSFAGRSYSFDRWKKDGFDAHSAIMWPNFVRPNAPAALLDLHLQGSTAAERRGATVANYSTHTSSEDFDGEIRANLSPVDIGADAGNYIPVDLDAPVINASPLSDASDTASRFISVQINDTLSGLPTTGPNRPTIWYRKLHPSVTAWQFAYGDLVSGTSRNGTWKFYINHQLLNVSAIGNDSIQYYFVAQDTTGRNVTLNPSGGAVHQSVTQQVTPPSKPYVYRIYVGGGLSPVINVGANERFTSLTKDGGLFEALLRDTARGDITIRITSHLHENGNWPLDSLLNRNKVRIKIVPALDSLFIIKNDVDNGKDLIRLNGYDGLTIDGSFNGSGRWLRFVSTHTAAAILAGAAISLDGACDSISILNTELQGNAGKYQTEALLVIQNGNGRDLQFRNNIFSNVPGLTEPTVGIYTWKTRPDNIVIAGNHFVNMYDAGVYFTQSAERLRIDSNHFYRNTTSPHRGIVFFAIQTHVPSVSLQVKGNFIGGSAPFCAGNPWLNNASFLYFYGIQASVSNRGIGLLENNTFKNIKVTHQDASNFFGMSVTGPILTSANTIGDTTNDRSIESSTDNNVMIDANPGAVVTGNLISGVVATSTTEYFANIIGIRSFADSGQVIRNNIVRNLSSTSPLLAAANAIVGIRLSTSMKNGVVEGNEIFNLSADFSGNSKIYGIEALSANDGSGTIRRNRIYNLLLPNSTNGVMAGISTFQNGNWSIENNQITLTNGAYTNPVNVYGIYDNATSRTGNAKSIAYNTILIGGAQSGGSTSSLAYYKDGIGTVTRFKNNLLFNVRSGSTMQHGAIGIKRPAPGSEWLPAVADFNLYVVKDTASAFLWNISMHSFQDWKVNSAGDRHSYVTMHSMLPAKDFFADSSKGNLNINTASSISWYVNGKGLPQPHISADYNQENVRSINPESGPTDIGSHEFNTSAMPPALLLSGNHQPGGADTLSFNGRIVAIINWGSSGSLPDLGTARLYSGIWPNDLNNNNIIANARYMSSFIDIPATGGTGYSYDFTLFYDSSMLGKVIDPATMVINKRETGVPGSWKAIHPTIVDTARGTLTIFSQTSFSEFAVTDSLATFESGAPSADLTLGSPTINNTSVPTGAAFTVSVTEKNIGGSSVSSNKIHFYLSSDNILTAGNSGDTLLGESAVTVNLLPGGTTGIISKQLTMPCNVTPGNYFLFIVADADRLVNELSESNNAVSLPITVTAGLTVPAPVIAATPAAVVCAPGLVTLTASSTGCTNCTYKWSNGSVAPSIQVNASGTYTVTATNSCGSASVLQAVTVNPLPSILLSRDTTICAGSSVQLTVSGATTYAWSPATGLSAATGTTVTASPATTTTYTVTGTSNGCKQTKNIRITVNQTPAAPIIVQSGNALVSSATNGNQWYLNGILIPSANTASYVPTIAGLYTVRVTVDSCTGPLSAAFNYSITGINSPEFDRQMLVAPNPVIDRLNIRYTGAAGQFTVTLTDISGRLVIGRNSFSGNISLDVTSVKPGLYIVRLINNRTGEHVDRLILKK